MAANAALLSASSPSTSAAAASFLSRRPLPHCRAAFPRRAGSRLSISKLPSPLAAMYQLTSRVFAPIQFHRYSEYMCCASFSSELPIRLPGICCSAVAALGDDPIKEWILTEGKATQIKGTRSIGGGCINSAQRYDTDAGPFFVKTNRIFVYDSRIGPEMFEGEALGLKAMYETNSIRVPLPYMVRQLAYSGLCKIACFVRNVTSVSLIHPPCYCSTPQINTWTADWIEFYSKHRLGYQLELASRRYGDSAIYEKGQRLIKNIRPLFYGAVLEPCLLHGDLWSGNISSDTNGDPVILDPACYYGHNEAEFGMSWCAGFGGEFYNAYFQVMPKQPGFEKRRDLYLLYHYLNHYNLFGSGYRSSAMSIIEDYLYLLAA
ncbi:hypothetical protein HU200_001889 [Digitaria exilis]|uniref:Protein-ribulosamine 3-kinase, chloroplastic n=1 Tax=Digitaria exilis TaxID=1010633 RepID=A0A835KXC3_9POAL|nr:hypothetical protein HU200_001889 [Digitaria exilis]